MILFNALRAKVVDFMYPRIRVPIATACLCGVFTAVPLELPLCYSEDALASAISAPSAAAEPALEKKLLDLLNRERSERGLPRLLADGALARIAREHSRKMASQGTVSHDLPGSGNLEFRLNRAGYLRKTARENVASAVTVEEAYAALMKSPGHRRNILAADVSHAGMGIARGSSPHERELYITQVFAFPLRRLQAAEILKSYLSRVREARERSGCGPLRRDPDLDRIAAKVLADLAAPVGKDTVQRLARSALARIPQAGAAGLSAITADVQLIRDENDLQIGGALREASARVLGAAAREAPDDRGNPVMVIVSLVGLLR